MKKLTICILSAFFACFLFSCADVFAQSKSQNPEVEKLQKPYNPEADAQKDIDSLVNLATIENKNIIIQAGGNWCIWCLRFNNFIHSSAKISELLDQKYLYYHLNYSPENKNEVVFNKYAKDKGQEFGYPFFIILNKNGEVLTSRESGNLELGKGYDESKVLDFFNQWIPKEQ